MAGKKKKTLSMSKTEQSPPPIKAHSSAIQMTHKLTLTQHKTWLILLRQAYKDLGDSNVKKHKMRLSELNTYLGYTSNRNDRYLKSLLEELVDTKVSWNVFDKDGAGEWGVASLLAGCKIKKGVVEYDYSTFLREKLYSPNMFALLNLKILNQFKSKYALAIYNLCKDYLGVSHTPVMELEKFREFVGLEEHEYADFKSLNRRVIKEPIAEINSLSDIVVTPEYFKEGRRVVKLQFQIFKNPQMKLDINSITDQVMQSPSDDQEEESDSVEEDPLYKRLLSFGLKPRQIKKFMADYERAYLIENLNLVEKDSRAGSVKNVTAYAVAAIKDDYRPRKTFIDAQVEESKAKASKAKEKAEKAETVKTLKEEFELTRLEGALSNLSAKAYKKLESEFLNADIENKVFVMNYYRDRGFDNIVVKSAFYAFAKERLLDSAALSLKNFKKFIREKGYNPNQLKEQLELAGGE